MTTNELPPNVPYGSPESDRDALGSLKDPKAREQEAEEFWHELGFCTEVDGSFTPIGDDGDH